MNEKKQGCEYCDLGKPLITGPGGNDRGVCILHPNKLNAYGYDIHGFGHNGFVVTINYCPMCGKKLEKIFA